MQNFDKLWTNATIVDFKGNDFFLLKEYALGIKEDKITFLAPTTELKEHNCKDIYDLQGKVVTAGLIDCHTHLVYGGNRADEFERRLQGESYESIAKSGGGIKASIQKTRELNSEDIFKASSKRLKALLKEGVTTVEIKTGYGLDTQSELKMLRIAKHLEESFPVHIEKTFLGAHATPPEFAGDNEAYIKHICEEMLPTIAKEKLASCVDAYCENIAFTPKQCQKVFEVAKKYGLGVKLHAEQFSDIGASKMAAKYKALSVDHLEYITEDSIKALAKSDSVAVLLPGAFYFLREKTLPPIALLRKYNIPLALATDMNPGTSPLASLLLMLNMGSTLFRLTPAEALKAVTINAAKALGLEKQKGSISIGKDADFCVWDVSHPRELVCEYLPNNLLYSVQAGRRVHV